MICKIGSSTRSSNVIPCIFYSPPLFLSLLSSRLSSVFHHSLLSFSSASSSPSSSSPPILRPLFASSLPFLPNDHTAYTQVRPLSRDYLKYRGQNNGISIARNAADVYLQLFIASRCSTQRNHAPGQSNAIVERAKETSLCRIQVSIDPRNEPQSLFLRSIVSSFLLFSPTFASSTDFLDSSFIRLDSDLPGFEVVCFD